MKPAKPIQLLHQRSTAMPTGQRILWHFLLALMLVVIILLCMVAGIALRGSREDGMQSGLALGLFVGQLAFAWRFLRASFRARAGAALGVFLLAAMASTLMGALGSATGRVLYGLVDIVLPYLLVTIICWEWIYRKQLAAAATNGDA